MNSTAEKSMAHSDINELLKTPMGLPFAKQLLKQYGEFYPFGVSMALDGKVNAIGATDGDEHPPSEKIIELLKSGLKQEASKGHIRAGAIFFDVLTVPPGESAKCDAICVSLEHHSGEAYDAFIPYKRNDSGEFQYGKIFAKRRQPQFFLPNTTQESPD